MIQKIPTPTSLVTLGALLAAVLTTILRIEPSTMALNGYSNEGSNSRERVKDGSGGPSRWD